MLNNFRDFHEHLYFTKVYGTLQYFQKKKKWLVYHRTSRLFLCKTEQALDNSTDIQHQKIICTLTLQAMSVKGAPLVLSLISRLTVWALPWQMSGEVQVTAEVKSRSATLMAAEARVKVASVGSMTLKSKIYLKNLQSIHVIQQCISQDKQQS